MWPTAQEITNWFNIDFSTLSGEDQSTWENQRLTVIAAIEEYTNRKFEINTYNDKLRIDIRDPKILTQNYPIQIITEIRKAGEIVPSTDYRSIDSLGEIVRIDELGRPLLWEFDSYEIDYDAGFTVIPQLVLSAFYDLVLFRFNTIKNMSSGGLVKKSVIFGVSSIEFDNSIFNDSEKNEWGNFLKNYSEILDKYRTEKSFNLIYNADF